MVNKCWLSPETETVAWLFLTLIYGAISMKSKMLVHLAAGWLHNGGNSVLAEGHGSFVTSGKHFIWPFLHSGGLPACPAGSGSPCDVETSLPAGMRP